MGAINPHMGTNSSFAEAMPAYQADQWATHLQEVCGEFETISHDWSKFRGAIDLRNIGGFDVAGISMNADRVIRSRKQIEKSDNKYCFLILQLSGRSILSQRNNEAHLQPGDMALIDSAYPSEFKYDGFMQQISLHIPRATLESFLPYRRIQEARRISGRAGMGAVTKEFLASTYTEAAHIGEPDYNTVREVLLNLLGATLRGYSPDQVLDQKSRQMANIRKVIEQKLTDPGLTPSMVAELCGLSIRHLHRLFQAEGASCGEWIRLRRLNEARQQLADRRYADQNIIQIAFHWGFNDAAHFSRAFKQEFGLSPRQYRLTEGH
ncbi:transcriptional regulator FeaR [Paremcibacter congregatus]|uniref:transcriptional regulator FeaR n=1 Tax=Paremcibacter congregatus TaxID=2043170 RepID=UPI003A933A66